MKTVDDVQQRQEPPTKRRASVWVLAAVFVVVTVVALVTITRPAKDPAPQLDPLAVDTPTSLAAPVAPVASDLGAVTKSLLDLDYQLRIRPDPAGIARLLDYTNPGYAESVTAEQQLATGERRYDPPPRPYTIASVDVAVQGADTATVIVKHTAWPAFRVLDRSGAAVIDNPAGGPRTVVLTLRQRDGVWRIANSERLS